MCKSIGSDRISDNTPGVATEPERHCARAPEPAPESCRLFSSVLVQYTRPVFPFVAQVFPCAIHCTVLEDNLDRDVGERSLLSLNYIVGCISGLSRDGALKFEELQTERFRLLA